MYIRRLRTWFAHGPMLLAATALLGVMASPLVAGQVKKSDIPVKLYFKYDLKQTKDEVAARGGKIIDIRPNTPQTVYLFLENTDQFGLKNLTVKLVKIENGGAASVVMQTPMDLSGSAAPESFKQVRFAAKEEKKPKKPIKVAGPPFEMQVWVEQPNKNTKRVMLPIHVLEPYEYVNFDEANGKYNPTDKTITVNLQKKSEFIYGSPTVVLLDLDPNYSPKILPVKTGGTYKQILTPYTGVKGPAKSVELKATNLALNESAPNKGRVYLTVDGVRRAYGFANLYNDQTMRPLKGMRMRIEAPRYFIPGEKMPVTVQVDNFRTSIVTPRTDVTMKRPKPPQVKLEWQLDTAGSSLLPVAVLDGHQEQSVSFNPAGPDGAIVFYNTVRDWTVDVDTSDLFGTKTLRATIVNAGGGAEKIAQETGEDEIQLFTAANIRGRYAPLSYVKSGVTEATAVKAEIVLDSTPPQVAFGNELEKKAAQDPRFVKGDLLRVKAVIRPQPPKTPIDEVVFFVGKPGPKNTIPKDAVKAIEVTTSPKDWRDHPFEKSEWIATFPIDTKKAGIHFISVQAKNQAGQVEFKTIKLVLVDEANGGGGKNGKATKVVGTVKTGDLPQAGVSVFLTDEKGVVKGFAKTGKKPRGGFVIKNVKPGSYKVTAANPALKLTGETFITVPEGVATVEAGTIQLKR